MRFIRLFSFAGRVGRRFNARGFAHLARRRPYHFWYNSRGPRWRKNIPKSRFGFIAPQRVPLPFWTGCAVSARTTGMPSGSTSCGAVRLADREAVGRQSQKWSLGSTVCAPQSPDSPDHPVFSRRHAGGVARVHQETQKTPDDDLALARRRMKDVTQ